MTTGTGSDSDRSDRRSARVLAIFVLALLASGSATRAQYLLDFGGPDRQVVLAGDDLPARLESFAVELRLFLDGRVPRPVALLARFSEEAEAADRGDFELSLLSSGALALRIRGRDGREERIVSKVLPRAPGWHRISTSWDGKKLLLCIDGKSSASEDFADLGALAETSRPLTIGTTGSRSRARPVRHRVLIADVALWKRARDLNEIGAGQEASGILDDKGLVSLTTLRFESPAALGSNEVAGGPKARLSPELRRSGWCAPGPRADGGPLIVSCHDLAAGDGAATIKQDAHAILLDEEVRGRLGVLWQEAADLAIRVTWADPVGGGQETLGLETDADELLVAGTADPEGQLYYLTVQRLPVERPEDQAARARLRKCDRNGKILVEVELDVSRAAFNVWVYNPKDGGSLRHSKGELGLVFPRTMYRSSDGLRHQGAIAATFSAKTLELLANLGQTSGHSFGNVMAVSRRGDFLALDLGDNYPRGVHLHGFKNRRRTSAVVYTYKTRHGTKPRGGAIRYDEISGAGRTFYRWSNDNATYTELGGVLETKAGFLIAVASDRSLEGKVLDNSRAFRDCDDPRDILLLKVVKNIGRAAHGNEVQDSLMFDLPRPNVVETGGFYDFNGNWSPQRVTGLHWQTDHGKGEGAHSPRLVELDGGDVLLFWEDRNREGSRLTALRLDAKGNARGEALSVNLPLRLNRDDPAIRLGESICFLAADPADGLVRLYSFELP